MCVRVCVCVCVCVYAKVCPLSLSWWSLCLILDKSNNTRKSVLQILDVSTISNRMDAKGSHSVDQTHCVYFWCWYSAHLSIARLDRCESSFIYIYILYQISLLLFVWQFLLLRNCMIDNWIGYDLALVFVWIYLSFPHFFSFDFAAHCADSMLLIRSEVKVRSLCVMSLAVRYQTILFYCYPSILSIEISLTWSLANDWNLADQRSCVHKFCDIFPLVHSYCE